LRVPNPTKSNTTNESKPLQNNNKHSFTSHFQTQWRKDINSLHLIIPSNYATQTT
jgi:hypothetical protein